MRKDCACSILSPSRHTYYARKVGSRAGALLRRRLLILIGARSSDEEAVPILFARRRVGGFRADRPSRPRFLARSPYGPAQVCA